MRPIQLLHQLVYQKLSSFCPGNVTYFIERYFAALKNAPLSVGPRAWRLVWFWQLTLLQLKGVSLKAARG